MTNFLQSNMAAIPSVNSHSVPLPYTVWSQNDGIVIVFNIIDLYSLVLQLSHTHVFPSPSSDCDLSRGQKFHSSARIDDFRKDE